MIAIFYDLNHHINYTQSKHQYDKEYTCYRLDKTLYSRWAIQEYELLRPIGGNLIFCLEGDEEKALIKLIDFNSDCLDIVKRTIKDLQYELSNKYGGNLT